MQEKAISPVTVLHIQNHSSSKNEKYNKATIYLPPSQHLVFPHNRANTPLETMELCVQGYDDANKVVIEVGEKDTTETMRQKVAFATGLAEDSFHMGFGGKEEGEDITELSAGDSVVLTKTTKYQSVEELRALGETDISEARLADVKNPEVASLLLQAEVATVIPAGFLCRASFTRLDLSAVSGVTRIEHGFLFACRSVETVDLSGLCNVTHIGNDCLFDCTSLTSLDVSGFTGVRVIENRFLKGSGVTKLDLSHMTSVTTVGRHFLHRCSSLQSLDISGWRRITHIEDSFLSSCTSLATVDLSAFCSVTKIGSGFLFNCTSLTAISFSGMTNVTELTNNFCTDCTSLETIDLTALRGVVKVGYGFLTRCTSLTSIDLSAFGNATDIGHSFLSHCSSLKTVDLSVLRSIARIEQNWVQECSALTTADLSGLSNVENICESFLQECTSLTTLDISGIGTDTEIEYGFLHNCNALTTVVLPGNIDIHEMSLPNEAQENHGFGVTKTFHVRVRDIYARFTEQFGGVRTEALVRTDVSGSARQCIALKAGQEGDGSMQAKEDEDKQELGKQEHGKQGYLEGQGLGQAAAMLCRAQ